MAVAEAEAVLKIDIIGVDMEFWGVLGVAAVNAVVKGLELKAVAISRVAVPPSNQVVAGNALVRTAGLIETAAENIALEGDRIARTGCPVEPKTSTQPLPAVVRGCTIRRMKSTASRTSNGM